MKFVDEITLSNGERACRVVLFKGDLTEIPPIHRVDLLVLSAFKRDYSPTPNSLIGGLDRIHVSVGELAKAPEFVGVSADAKCWISRPIDGDPLNFHRLMCVEPDHPGLAAEAVNRAFLELNRYIQAGNVVRTVALPILATGDMGQSVELMTNALLDAVIGWFGAGMSVEQVKLVVRSENDLQIVKKIFEGRREEASRLQQPASQQYQFFLSYSRRDQAVAKVVYDELCKSGQSVFFDEKEIDIGDHWKAKFTAAANVCRCLVALYSDAYARSEYCQTEFAIVNGRAGLDKSISIYPMLLNSADTSMLPGPMGARHWRDCRIEDKVKLVAAAQDVVRGVHTGE